MSCLRGRGASRRHWILPVARSRLIVRSFSFSTAVTKIESLPREGEEWPGGRAVFQTTFVVGSNSIGRSGLPSAIPDALGPRNWGQSDG